MTRTKKDSACSRRSGRLKRRNRSASVTRANPRYSALTAAFCCGSYRITAEPSTHWGCADLCGANATLACVQSSEENEYVARLAADAGAIRFWIGVYQRPAGEEPGGGWDVCQSGETANFVKWDTSEPNNWRGAEECAVVGNGGLWFDVPCYLEFPCLCKSGADPSPEYMAFVEVERERDKSLRAAALVLHYMALTLCSAMSGLSLIWALVCLFRDVRRKDEQSAGAGLEMVQSDAGLGPHDQRVHASLLSRDVLLLRCSWLRSRPPGYARSACALTYGWLTPHHPDPHGENLQHVVAFLNSPTGHDFVALFWDQASLKDAAGKRTAEEAKIFAASLAVMAGLYASPRCVTVLRLTNIPEPPEWGKRSVCLIGLKNGIEEQAILATLGSFGQIETCELHTAPAIVRFATREAAVAAVAAGAEQLCKGIGMLYNTQPYERRGWCHAESNFAKIILGTRSELGLGSAEHAPKMIETAPTPNAFKAQFEETVEGSEEQVIAFTGKGDEEKVARAMVPIEPR
ncbi:hypothetical protein EMIHUDRAFT_198334 [Emiliania huxleyi CCMP1516]|uniref:C-type lectin domain-containing protein n=2 Tax=Emiliania huxleyi TaxID=2903 RepID=A0A0D3I733_EMIH1|nr:hypothetical protein EMIHUDRAFT_198334 [Emiliania huxleyi CCMP1516]EOD07068.1 hypothetical protein EMIHUDRAFT_198334 [Emiliania huxleyi CCMP1516]|eukprot:XP_005759497.1 hypothetical protein EMIHUDRAFT_198334 [Emiliania huxleyi CCMP1516]